MRRARNDAKNHPKRAEQGPFPRPGAFRKYNSTIRFIGFQPSARLIIDKSDNLEALSI
jgi:hypothetical protein